MNRLSLVVVGLSLMTVWGSAPNARAATELARINTSVITLEEFNQKYAENAKRFPFKAPTKQAVLDDLIKLELGVQEAKKLGLDRDPAVQERMNAVLFEALLDRNMGKELDKIVVTDEQAKAYYQKNPEIRTSHIFVGLPPGAKPEDEKAAIAKIRNIYDTYIRPGKMGFAEAAQKFSEGPAAAMGGDVDFQTRDRLGDDYYNAAVQLKPGAISGIVRTQFGFHIIKLTAVRSWTQVDQGLVKRILFEQRRNQLFEGFVASLRKKANVRVRADLIK